MSVLNAYFHDDDALVVNLFADDRKWSGNAGPISRSAGLR